jgi:hypothetical protein
MMISESHAELVAASEFRKRFEAEMLLASCPEEVRKCSTN